jgi:hypothetical protein
MGNRPVLGGPMSGRRDPDMLDAGRVLITRTALLGGSPERYPFVWRHLRWRRWLARRIRRHQSDRHGAR